MSKRNIQKEILLKLLASNGLKYSEACPTDVENDLYNYHLQFLVKKKLVDKVDNLYKLSELGQAHIERDPAMVDKDGFFEPFKISVLLLVTRIVDGKFQILLQTRTRKPYFGDTGILSGKVQKEEKVVEAAKRKLFDEANLHADFEDISLLRRMRYNKQDGELFSDSFWFLCRSTSEVTGDLNADYKHGKNFWGTVDEAIDFEEKSVNTSEFMLDYFKKLKKDQELEIPYTFIEEILDVEID